MGETKMASDELQVVRLEEAGALFALLGRLFHGVPDHALIAGAADERIFDEIPFAVGGDADAARKTLMTWTDQCASPFSDSDFREVSSEYTRLFVGTRRVLAPMWESVYFNKDRMVFQRQTFEVRSAYARYGLEVDALSHEPDDHLAYELLFIGRLCQLAAEAARRGDGAEADRIVADAVSFVVCHPMTWVPRWRESVEHHARCDFYRGYADLVVAALQQLESEFSGVCARVAAA